MNNARVKITLPQKEDAWFFVQQDTTVAGLRAMVQAEDETTEIFNALERPVGSKDMPANLGDDVIVYDLIKKANTEIILQLNDNFFELMTAKPVGLDIKYTTPIL